MYRTKCCFEFVCFGISLISPQQTVARLHSAYYLYVRLKLSNYPFKNGEHKFPSLYGDRHNKFYNCSPDQLAKGLDCCDIQRLNCYDTVVLLQNMVLYNSIQTYIEVESRLGRSNTLTTNTGSDSF